MRDPPARRSFAGPRGTFEDDALPELSVALDATGASRLFEERWREDARQRARVTSLHDVRYEPGRRCLIAWEVEIRPNGTPPRPAIGVLDVRPEALHVREFWDDPELPQLAAAVAPSTATRHVSFLSPGSRVERVAPVRYRPGSRCTLRYEMAGSAEPRIFFGKVLVNRAEHLVDVAEAIRGSVAAEGHRSPVVEPLGWCEPLRMLVLPCLGATRLHDLVFDATAPIDLRSEWMCEAGGTLARLHTSIASGLDSRGIEDDLEALSASSHVVAMCAPETWPAFDAAFERLAALPSAERSSVVSHGAFRTDQLLVVDGQTVMVDLDGLCLADPARDVGNLLAYLRWKAIRQPRHAAFLLEAAQSFLYGYGRLAPQPQMSRIAVHQAASMLKIAGRRFRRLDVGEWPLVPRLIDEADELLRARRPRYETPVAEITAARLRGTTRAATSGAPNALAEALDLDAMSTRLAPFLADGAGGSGRNGTRSREAVVSTAEVLAHRPGRRWTIRYVHDGGATSLIGKLYTDPTRGRRTHEIMQLLWEHRRAGSSELGVPQPVGWLPDLGMVVYVAVGGRGLGELLLSFPRGPRAVGALDGTARWLAELHRRSLPLDRMFDPERELVNVEGWATAIAERFPDLARLGTGVVARIQERASDLRVRSNVPIHKDFRHHHVFEDEITRVIDFDEARLGDPTFDLGHFCAYLRVLGHPHAIDRSRVAWLQDRFLNAYRRATGWAWDERFSTFMAYGCLKIASQLAAGSLPGHGTSPEIASRQVDAILREAERRLRPSGAGGPW